MSTEEKSPSPGIEASRWTFETESTIEYLAISQWPACLKRGHCLPIPKLQQSNELESRMKLPEKEENLLKAFDPGYPEDETSSEQLDPPPQTEAIDPNEKRIDEDFNDKEGQTEIWQSFESP
jgi:hypothetical protein